MSMPEIERLAKKAKGGEKDAFVALMETVKPSLLGVARAILKDEEDVADAMQDTVLRAYEGIGRLKKPACCKTWLTRILINRCYDLLRQRRTVPLEDLIVEEGTEYEWDTPLDVRSAMGGLNGGDRLVLVLFYVEDMSQKQMAEVLGVSENAVKQRLSRAKRHFRSVYEKGAAVNE